MESRILDIDTPIEAKELFNRVSQLLGSDLMADPAVLVKDFLEREKESSTVLRKGLAIPHIIVAGERTFKILLVRAGAGVIFPNDELVHIIFILAASSDERNLHLKALAAIAQITNTPGFDKLWLLAGSKEELRNIVLLAERKRG